MGGTVYLEGTKCDARGKDGDNTTKHPGIVWVRHSPSSSQYWFRTIVGVMIVLLLAMMTYKMYA